MIWSVGQSVNQYMTKFSLREHDILLRLEVNSEMDSASPNPPTPGSLWASPCRSSCSKLELSSREATLASWKPVKEAPLRAAVRIQLCRGWGERRSTKASCGRWHLRWALKEEEDASNRWQESSSQGLNSEAAGGEGRGYEVRGSHSAEPEAEGREPRCGGGTGRGWVWRLCRASAGQHRPRAASASTGKGKPGPLRSGLRERRHTTTHRCW